MKKIIFFVFALACISTMSNAQDVKTIKPFKPNAEDAAKIKTILAGMSKSAYSIEVRGGNKSTNYGALGRTNVKSGVAVTSQLANKAGTWVEELLMKALKSTKSIDVEAVQQLQAIAAKY